MILAPELWWKVGAYALVAATGFGYGFHVADMRRQAVINQLQADVQLQEQQADIALAHWEKERNDREHYQDALQARLGVVASRPDYRALCLDPDGVRLANDALGGAK